MVTGDNAIGQAAKHALAVIGDNSLAVSFVVEAPPSGPRLRDLPIFYKLRKLPQPYTQPGKELDALREGLVGPSRAAHGVVGSRGLLGMGGIGKTVLAAALTHDPVVRETFPAGVIWLSFGRDANVRLRQDELILALTGAASPATSVEEARGLVDILAQQLPERLLLVLDDVWEAAATHAAFGDLPDQIQLLVTTRDRAVLRRFGASEHTVELLDRDAALDFLARSAGVPRVSLPADSGEILRRCGGLRLALSAVGALVRAGHYDWSEVRLALEQVRLEEFPDDWRGGDGTSDLASVLKVSLDALSPEARACINDFAVFQEDVAIPKAALTNLWVSTAKSVPLVISELSDRSILIGDTRQGYLVHDLYRDFLRGLLGDPVAKHRNLITRYGAKASGGWANGPDDGYFYQALPWHLVQADLPLDLLYEPRWLARKLAVTDLGAVIADCRLMHEDRQANHVGAALGLSADTLRERPQDLNAQLCGRLSYADGPHIERLVTRARRDLPSDQMMPVEDGFLDAPGRLQRILRGHQGFINAVVTTADGRRAVSAAEDQRLILWDLETGANLQTFTGHGGGVNAVCLFEPHGVMLSVDDHGAVLFWSLEDGQLLRRLHVGSGSVDVIVALSDGWRAVSAGSSEGLMVWDAVARAQIGALPGSSGRILSLLALADGRVVSGDQAGRVVVWDVSGGIAPLVLEAGGEPVRALLALSDAQLLAIHADGVAVVLSLDGAPRYLAEPAPIGHHAFAVVPQLHLAASGMRDGSIQLWQLADGLTFDGIRAHGDQVAALAVAPGRPWLISGSLDQTLRVWDLTSHRDSRAVGVGLLSLALSPSGMLAVAGEDGEIFFSAVEGRDKLLLARRGSGVRAMAFLPDGLHLVSADDGGQVMLTNIGTRQSRVVVTRHPSSISRILVQDSKSVLLLGGHGGLERLDLGTGRVKASQEGHSGGVASATMAPDGRLVTGGHDGDIRLWDLQNGGVSFLRTEAGPVNAVQVRRGARQLFSASGNGELRLWDLETGQVLAVQGERDFARETRRGFQLAHGVLAACLLPDERFAALCCGDNSIRIWDLKRGVTTKRFSDDHLAPACGISADQRFLIVPSQGGRVQVFELAPGAGGLNV